MIHTVKGFGIVNKAEIYVFLELSCFFNDPADVGNFISGSSALANLDSILKSRDITLPTKVHLVKAMVFPVVIYDVRAGKLSTEELMLLNCGVGEDS